MTARGTLVALLIPLALLSACGDDSGSSVADPSTADSTATQSTTSAGPSESTTAAEPETPDWPACGDVWVADTRLKAAYKGCLDGTEAVKADNLSCESGQRIVRYTDRFYAVAGGKIYQTMGPLEKDKGYLEMVTTCRG